MHYSFISSRCLCSDVPLVFAYQFKTMKAKYFCFHVEVFHEPAQNKFRFQPERFSIYHMGTMHPMKEVLMAEERSVIKFYELQYLNERGRSIKEKSKRQHQDLFLLFYMLILLRIALHVEHSHTVLLQI